MSEIGFSFYKVPDPLDNVCDLGNEMIFTQDMSKIVKDVYPDTCVEEIDMKWVKAFLSYLNLDNAKIIMSGKDLIHH